MYNTGFHWLSEVDLVDAGGNIYGSSANWITQARIADDLANNKVAVLDVEGAKTIALTPFASSKSAGSAADSALLQIYGAIGFGEVTQSSWDNNPVLITNLSNTVIGTTASGSDMTAVANQLYDMPIGVATQLALTNPATGNTYTEYVGGSTNVDVTSITWTTAVTYALAANTSATSTLHIAAASGVAGMSLLSDISIFQKLFFTVDAGALSAVSANALVARLY